ncbi:SIMPL domain-containing protein [bacterium]|nr:SIMPL domain-containing protein [bacterium]
MLEKLEKFQILTLGALIGLALIVSTKIASSAMARNEISVTGSAFEIVKSDKGSLEFDIHVKKPTKQEAYATAQNQYKEVEKYLKDKGIKNIELKTSNGYDVYKNDPKTGYSTNIPEAYNYYQPVLISSDNVEVIREISNDITGLINQGINIEVRTPSYDYSKMADLKVSLLEKASQDAKNRAKSMLKPTGSNVGKVKSVRMGVYQITPVDSTNVSDMGINDTSTIDKKITAVANVTFKIK